MGRKFFLVGLLGVILPVYAVADNGDVAGDFALWADYLAVRQNYVESSIIQKMEKLPPQQVVARGILHAELRQAVGQRAMVAARQALIRHWAALAAPLRMGEVDRTVLVAFDSLVRQVIPAAVLRDAMSQEAGDLIREDFSPWPESTKRLARPFPGGNFGDLIEFLRVNELTTRKWSRAHFRLLDVCVALTEAAEKEIEKLKR